MKTLMNPIGFNETSHNVALLHKALDVLGLPAAAREVALNKAGVDTRKKVRAFQKKLNVPLDNSTLINDATTVAIIEELTRRNLTAAERSFTVTGTVWDMNQTVRKQQTLLAFDLDLRAVAIYRSVKNPAEIRKHGGFDFLGQAVSDNQGNYRIRFYDWQCRRGERKQADVVVYAVESGNEDGQIIGQSRVVSSGDYSADGLVTGLDVTITQVDERVEYEIVMTAMNALLKESETTLREIARSEEQLTFTARELDLDPAQVKIAAQAELLAPQKIKRLAHELLYGICRQSIPLEWMVLYKTREEELRDAITQSVEERIIHPMPEAGVAKFLLVLRTAAGQEVLARKAPGNGHTLDDLLSPALPTEAQRAAFVDALATFTGGDYELFWTRHLPDQPEFKDHPELISKLLFTQQLTALTGNHPALVRELQADPCRKISSVNDLLALSAKDWTDLIARTGVPAFVEGKDDDEKKERYAGFLQGLLGAAFPTKRIARMIEEDALPIEKTRVARGAGNFLSQTTEFDFASSRIHDFDQEIRAAAGDDAAEVRSELMRIQRVFQVSTRPEAMAVLMEHRLNSAFTIANVPRKSFIESYGDALGGKRAAFAIHERASHIATRTEMAAMRMIEYSKGTPKLIMGAEDHAEAMAALENHVPNYTELFGSPDICECEHCRSVESAAAYLVDLLRFLWRSAPNDNSKTPLDMLKARRPDLLYLPLTCENTNTIIPYIDLANEVMEYFTAHGSLANFEGHDTGDASANELRANPQNFDLEAYRTVKDAKYPFTLPYHQPLDVIRTYSDRLGVSRYETMEAVNVTPAPADAQAIAAAMAAESLRLSQEEYRILSGQGFDGVVDPTPLHTLFGFGGAGQLENLSAVPEFLRRSGIKYTDLVELMKTQFINPHQGAFEFLEKIFAHATINADTIYSRLGQIAAGALNPAADADIMACINAYNTEHGTAITAIQFGQWVTAHLPEFRQVITLYEPDSKCSLENTKLRTMQSIYENLPASGISNNTWSKLHRFIRLWRKLGWTIHETDLMLAALDESDITAGTIAKLEFVARLKAATKLPLDRLAVFWGNIDTYGEKSLYKKLFLNKAVQQIDEAFKPDAWGDYLQDNGEVLEDHQSGILAAFRLRDVDLAAILAVARVIDGGIPRAINPSIDILNHGNLSTIYRYAVLAKALKMRVPDLCKLTALFGPAPFSSWNVPLEKFLDILPGNTWEFYQIAEAAKKARFKASVLEYILQGTVPPDSTLGLDRNKVLQTARAIRDAFSTIELNHTETPPAPLTPEIIIAKLALTFQPETVTRFLDMLQDTATFETITTNNLIIAIPDDLAVKLSYVKGSGRLTWAGVMSDPERVAVKALNGNLPYKNAVEELYAAPGDFIIANFDGVFSNLAEAQADLLNHPAQAVVPTLEDKFAYVYTRFIPLLKRKLRRDAITQHIAALIGLNDEATALLIAADVDTLIAGLSTEGFSATYFTAANWTNPALQRTDPVVDFDWDGNAPNPLVPADNFSVRWEGYLAAPASGEYTLTVDVAEPDEVLKLYLDDALLVQKTAADAATSWEAVANLNAGQMHLLKLEYAETAASAGVRLRWKTSTTALDIVPAEAAYPASILQAFAAQTVLYHRAAKLISGFQLNAAELDHLIEFKANFVNIDFKALTAAHWKRLADYTALRSAVPQAQARLTDVFALANTPNPVPTVASLTQLLHQATAWDPAGLAFLINTQFKLGVNDFKNEIKLRWLRDVMEIAAKTGLSAQTIAEWGKAETDFDLLHATAQLIKNAVKAGFEEEDWLKLAGTLSDKLRENQKQALVAYLLTRPAVQAWGAKDADGLFEYLLIDVQMCPCMDTSRVVQANAAIQMFVNRCLLNLESQVTAGGDQIGVAPGVIDRDRWEWIKTYRLWQADRVVFLFPENLLEPEWRKDRSEQFKEAESYLVQNDITDRSVEQAFRNYLTGLNDLANLEVFGAHQQNHEGKLKYLHVFARTRSGPYKFFYRRWNEDRKWSAWEKVPVDVRSVENSGYNGKHSGVHLVPVIWKDRLFLFWPEFTRIEKSDSTQTSRSMEAIGKDDSVSSLRPQVSYEVRLSWSEYVAGKWSPKQLSKEMVEQEPHGDFRDEKDLLFTVSISAATQELIVTITDADYSAQRGTFRLADIQSEIVAADEPLQAGPPESDRYRYHFNRRQATKQQEGRRLTIDENKYLRNKTKHRLLPVDTMKGLDITLESPFFFSHEKRTYFVRPIEIPIYDLVKRPHKHSPFVVEIVDAGFRAERVPPVGPDDYLPAEEILRKTGYGPEFAGGAPVYRYNLNARGQPVMLGSAAGRGTREIPLAEVLEMRPAPVPGKIMLKETDASISFTLSASEMSASFGMFDARRMDDYLIWSLIGHKTGLEFHTFYHPFSSDYIRNLNQRGMPGLMESDTTIPSDDGATFDVIYDPDNDDQFLVPKPTDFATRTYYKENVCFDVYGANSLYNWELFFHLPLYIATRLSKNGKFEEAMKWFHYIFDPTTDEMPGPGESEVSRYWKVLPFKTTPAQSLEDWFRTLMPNTNPSNPINAIIAEWRRNPFDPHLVASNRPLAYMKHVVMKYVENLIDWGDSLLRQFTRETVYEALQLYVIAKHVLGPSPEFVPKRGEIKAESYESLKNKWDDFSNALVQLENIFPYSSEASVSVSSPGTSLLGVGPALYFCIPPNKKLMDYYHTVDDRLYKIRHCQDIDGNERKLALFAPPIDPAAILQAGAQGLSLGSILADLSSPPPIYRFTFLIQKANEFCADVKALGEALLAALEKKDAEELGRLRASHETQMLELMQAVKERQVLDAKAYKDNLLKGRDLAKFRVQHYLDLLGIDSVTLPPEPSIDATLTADSQLPADTAIGPIKTDVDESLVDGDEAGIKLIPKEKEEIDNTNTARGWQIGAQSAEGLAAIAHVIPTVSGDGKPFGVGAGASWGGTQLGNAFSAGGKICEFIANFSTHAAALAVKTANYIRREQDWTLQANLAGKEIIQLDKQITSADIRIQMAEKELTNHKQQIENSKTVELFLKEKFTSQELYQWMKEQLFAVYKQSYNLAYDLARKAEKAYKYELGTETVGFIQYGYWDSAKQGLVAGEKLQLALRQLEKSYLEENRRTLEITKSISFAQLNPHALIQLRETGKCDVLVPEELFDLDFRGHYFRRLKSVRLSVPCVAGPYTGVNCSLRLLSNSYRINTAMNGDGKYEHENDEGLWIDDDRFRACNVPVTAIATGTTQNNSGMFEFSFRDDRYLPFEGAGAVTEWQIELCTEKALRQFDYSTISDVILHLDYTAKEDNGLFKDKATEYLNEFILNAADLTEQPLRRLFSLKHEFPTQWHKFLHPAVIGAEQLLKFTIGKERFPFFAQDDKRDVVVLKIDLFTRCAPVGNYKSIISYFTHDDDPAADPATTSTEITLQPDDDFGGLKMAVINVSDAGLDLEEFDITKEMSLKLKRQGVANFASLATNPQDEVEDVYLVMHYKLVQVP